MVECESCGKTIEKVSVVSRSSLHVNKRERESVDEKYYCPACTKELPTATVAKAALESFKKI